MSLKTLKEKFDKISEEEIDVTEINELEERISELEEEIYEEMGGCFKNEEYKFKALLKRIDTFKKENDFYDAEAELDSMFPNRYDEDFDEDSMSYDSVFGDD